jgi:nitrite reductase (cytochrome c-552)
MQAGATAEDLAAPRKLLRQGQYRWDFIAANNGMGFHSAQESMRLLGEAANLAQQARIEAARLLARQGVLQPPTYPDISTREKAWDLAQSFVEGRRIKLLP